MKFTWLWALPFGGLLACMAVMPLISPSFWRRYYPGITGSWIILSLGGYFCVEGGHALLKLVKDVLLAQYIPFMCLMSALFIVSGGIHVSLRMKGAPLANTLLLGVGSLLANFIGTTGAALLLIRPYLHINAYRRYKTHLVIFFIFMVCNIGGCLTPLGDPPLFLGFLEGVPLLWPLQHLSLIFLSLMVPLLAIFLLVDLGIFYCDRHAMQEHEYPDHSGIRIQGKRNIPWLILIMCSLGVHSLWENPPEWGGIKLADLISEGSLLIIALASWLQTPRRIYTSNHFSYEPLKEVGIFFLAIFMTLAPLMKALDTHRFAEWVNILNLSGYPRDLLYFWMTGITSSFLDNAPTYLIFSHLAGGDAFQLSRSFPLTLAAISCGSVFMGAMTYIGNAPNFVVKTIAEHRHIKMPGFGGYLLWSCSLLLPLLIGVSWYWWGYNLKFP